MGEEGIHSPLIPPGKAGLLLAFEPGEALRNISFLAPGGALVVLDRGIAPIVQPAGGYRPADIPAYLQAMNRPGPLFIINGEELIRRCGSARTLNTALLGAAIGKGFFPFTMEDAVAVIRDRVAPRFHAMNLDALAAGAEIV
jgi:indolepyruvate ferredoxin oxidoreductase beta subunit